MRRGFFGWKGVAALLGVTFIVAGCGSGKGTDTGETTETGEVTDTGETTETTETTDTATTGTPPAGTIYQGVHSTLDISGGCGDMFAWAAGEDDTVGLFVSVGGIVQQTFDSGEESKSFTVDVGDDSGEASLTIQAGERITIEACNDVIYEDNRPVVVEEMSGVSGSATIVITPNGPATEWGELPAMADITLEGVTMSDGAGNSITIESFNFEAFVGWMPG